MGEDVHGLFRCYFCSTMTYRRFGPTVQHLCNIRVFAKIQRTKRTFGVRYDINAWALLSDIWLILPYDIRSNAWGQLLERSSSTNGRMFGHNRNSKIHPPPLTSPNILINSNKANLTLFNFLGYYKEFLLTSFKSP